MTQAIAIIVAEYLFLLPVLVGSIYFLLQPLDVKKNMVIFSVIVLPVTVFLLLILNQIYDNPRPDVVLGFSPFLKDHFFSNGFPSSHATLTALIAIVLYVFNRKIGLFLLIISIFISLARVYLGLHHLVDIIGGTLLAIIVTVMVQNILRKHTSLEI